MSSLQKFLSNSFKEVTPHGWDDLIKTLENRFRHLEESQNAQEKVAADILKRGLQVIEDGIGPSVLAARSAVEQINELASFLSAESSSEVTLGTGNKEFLIAPSEWPYFVGPKFVVAYVIDQPDKWMAGETQSWNKETGQLLVNFTAVKGDGTFSNWGIAPVAIMPDAGPTIDAYTKTETDNAIDQAKSEILGAAPDALDTLAELAEAFNNDGDFATNVTVQLTAKADKSGTLDQFAGGADGDNIWHTTGRDLRCQNKRAMVGFSTDDGNVLAVNYAIDFEWLDLYGKLRNNVDIFRDWPGVQLHPTANGGFGYIDFVKHDRPNQDFQFRLRSDPTSEQMVLEHYDDNDVYSHIYSLTGDGNIWSKSYGWLHDKFAAKDEVSAWEHIQTISTDTPVLDFTFQNLSQFRALRLTFDVRPDTDHAQLWLRTSRDNGANFDAGASDYGYVQHYAWQAGQGYGGGHSSTAFVLAANLGNASSAYRVAGELQLTELNKPKRTYMKGEYFNLNRSPDLVSYGFGGLNAHAEANDAIRIFFNAGQIAEGYATLEGIKG